MEESIIHSLKELIILVFSLVSIYFPNQPVINNIISPQTDEIVVNRVIDGDTVELSTGERVRYIGIDTPEIDYENGQNDCYAIKAKEVNKKLVEKKQVILEKDVSNKDKYDRLLRYIYVENNQNNKIFVNEFLIKNGYATLATYPPDVKYVEKFKKAQSWARENNMGLWKECF